ncbi:MAG: metallophosphoesterase [Candidatus Hydrogenedentota bacterium]|nr:MAG: metallophosphoesterase [Candidatus Hydrogenedentota bacterium]
MEDRLVPESRNTMPITVGDVEYGTDFASDGNPIQSPCLSEKLCRSATKVGDLTSQMQPGSSTFGRLTQVGRKLRRTFLGHHRLLVRHFRVQIEDLPHSLTGLRIAHLTDLHHGPWVSTELILETVHLVNRLRPDLVLLTGDYVSSHPRYLLPGIRALAHLRPRIATLGVLGNHDWWVGAQHRRADFASCGIGLIDRTRLFLTPERQLSAEPPPRGLCFAGIGDYWEDQLRPSETFASVPSTIPRIVLSHNPDAAEDPCLLACGERVDLMLAGHTHGGQVRLPSLPWAYAPSRYGTKYLGGWVQAPKFPVFVSVGVGSTGIPLRFGVAPEVVVFDLCPGERFTWEPLATRRNRGIGRHEIAEPAVSKSLP